MANDIAKRDENDIPVLTGITDDANQEIRMLRVNPLTGRLLISGINSGGGSGTFQVPISGAVNGSNTTFTWATAPVTITVDEGRSMQKVSSDGTVNWTGTTITVLAIAPIFDIYSGGSVQASTSTFSYTEVSANYVVGANDYTVNCTANTFTVTLPLAVAGKVYNIKNTGTGVITVQGTSGQLIDGLATQSLNQWSNIQLQAAPNSYIII